MILSLGSLSFSAEKSSSHEGQGSDLHGTWRHYEKGLLLSDRDGNPFAFVVNNRWGERFLVSVSMTEKGIRFMHALSSIDRDRFGFSSLSEEFKAAEQVMSKLAALTPARPKRSSRQLSGQSDLR